MSTELPIEQPSSLDESGPDEPLVGRHRELQVITAGLARVLAGQGRLEIVSADAGMGKTRLARETASIARREGFSVLRGTCWEGEGAPAYWPWVDLLRDHLEAAGDPAAEGSDLSELLRAASARMPVVARAPINADKDAQQARFVLFDWFCEVLAALAARRPTLVIVEDLHWADAGSLLLLQFIVERLATLPIAVLATGRDPLPAVAKELGRHEQVAYRTLGGLTRDEAAALFAARVECVPAADIFDQVMHLTGGNPYFLCELAQLWKDGSHTEPQTIMGLPPSLAALTEHQLGRLSPTGLALVRAAAVIGRAFDPALAARVSDVPIADAMSHLDDAVTQRILTRLPAGRFRFRHALVREAIDERIQLADRTRLHERIAIALEQEVRAGRRISPTALAHHFCMALPFTHRRRAGAYAVAAGEAAQDTLAYEDAILQFRRAQDAYGPTLSDRDTCDILLKLGAAQTGAGALALSRHTFECAATLARRADCPERLTRAALGFRGMMWATIPADLPAISLLEDARTRLKEYCQHLEVELLCALSKSLYYSHHVTRAHNYSSRASRLAAGLGDQRLEAIALEAHAVCLLRPDRIDALLASADDLAQRAEALGDAELLFNSRIFRQFGLLTIGDTQAADRELLEAASISATVRNPRFAWQVSLLESARATFRGYLPLAEEIAQRAQELGRRVHDSSATQYSLLQVLQRALLRDEVDSLLDPAAALSVQHPTVVGFRIARALILARLSHTSLAAELIHEVAYNDFEVIPRDNLFIWLMTMTAEAIVLAKMEAYADTAYQLLLPYAHHNIVAAWGTLIDGSVSHYLGIIAAFQGHYEAATLHFEAAIQRHRHNGAPALTARSQLAYARSALTANITPLGESVQTLVESAANTFHSLGFAHLSTLAKRLVSDTYSVTISKTEPPAPANHSAANQFTRDADFWIVAFAGKRVTLKHTLGLQYLAALLAQPRQFVHVLDLTFPTRQTDPDCPYKGLSNDTRSDERARSSYRRRLQEIDVELSEATSNNDLGTIERLSAERRYIMTELAGSFGLDGRPRPLGSDSERARISVRNRISSAFSTLDRHHPVLARELRRSIKTGVLCIYDPTVPTSWVL